MKTSNDSDNNIFQTLNNHIEEVKNSKSITFSLIMLIAGLVLTIVPLLIVPLVFSLKIFLIIAGVTMAIIGICKMLFGSKHYVLKENGSKIKLYPLYFDKKDLPFLKQFVSEGNIQDIMRFKNKDSNQGVRMDIIVSDDAQFAATQIYEYRAFNYEPVSEVYDFSGKGVSAFQSLINAK